MGNKLPLTLERAEGVDHLTLLDGGVLGRATLPAHRGDRPRDQLGDASSRRTWPSTRPSISLRRSSAAGVVALAGAEET